MHLKGLVSTYGVILLLAVNASSVAGTKPWKVPPIQIVDESGKPLPQSEVCLQAEDGRYLNFAFRSADSKGEVIFESGDISYYPMAVQVPERKFNVLVMSRGRSPVITKWELPTTSPLTVTVPARGKQIELHLKSATGKPVPADLTPRIVPLDYAHIGSVPPAQKIESPVMKPLGEGHYQFTLDETSTAPQVLIVQHPGYLQGYSCDLDTTAILASGRWELELPRPATVEVDIQVSDTVNAILPDKDFSISLAGTRKITDDSISIRSQLDDGIKLSGSLTKRYEHLAPGTVAIALRDVPESNLYGFTITPKYWESQELTVGSGETTTTKFLYEPFDTSVAKGPGRAEIHVKTVDGKPAANLPVRMRYADFSLNSDPYYTVTSGTLDDKGTTVIDRLTTSLDSRHRLELIESRPDNPYGGNRIGRLEFSEGKTSATFEFTLAPKEGDMAPDITLYDVHTSQPVTLSSLRGKVVFLDFWATWCGPCQEPMAHNQKALEENGAQWGDRVVIVGASIDDDAETVVSHVKKNKWESVRHLWCGDGSFKSAPSRTYGVDGVPTALLIDQSGKIVWRGHPFHYKLKDEIDKLLVKNPD